MKEILAKNLRQFRGKKTQADFADFLGLPMRTYVNIELGNAWPQLPNIEQMAEKLGIAEGQLFADSELMLRAPKAPKPSVTEALEIIKNALERAEGEQLSPLKRRIVDALSSLNEEDAAPILELMNKLSADRKDRVSIETHPSLPAQPVKNHRKISKP